MGPAERLRSKELAAARARISALERELAEIVGSPTWQLARQLLWLVAATRRRQLARRLFTVS